MRRLVLMHTTSAVFPNSDPATWPTFPLIWGGKELRSIACRKSDGRNFLPFLTANFFWPFYRHGPLNHDTRNSLNPYPSSLDSPPPPGIKRVIRSSTAPEPDGSVVLFTCVVKARPRCGLPACRHRQMVFPHPQTPPS
jgi:hypothetical protein